MTTLVFAVYAFSRRCCAPGPRSDTIGRRRMLVPALLLAAAASAILAAAHGLDWLFAGRAAQSVALVDMEPHGDRRRASATGAAATAAGVAIGPLLSGLLAQFLPTPRVLPTSSTTPTTALPARTAGSRRRTRWLGPGGSAFPPRAH